MNSVWTNTEIKKSFDRLDKDIEVDTAIIGGGLCGLLCAYKLKEKGIDAIVLEADKICCGQTKNTTAKITSQHGLIYNKIEKYYGINALRQYAELNEQAIQEYDKIISENGIHCDFEQKKAYIFSTEDTDAINREYASVKKTNIDCYLTTKSNLPFKIKQAIVFNNQAQFNPIKFVNGIIEELNIYEHTPVTRIIGNTIYTNDAIVRAKNIIVATNYPFINFPSLYFLKISRERSYVVAIEKNEYELDGMYIGIGDDALSFRDYDKYILVGGENHRTGIKLKHSPIDTLKNKATLFFPSHKIVSTWSAQDSITLDSIPYIKRFSKSNKNIFVATGFNKWGMTGSMVSAMILSDMISKGESKNSDIFTNRRLQVSACITNAITNAKESVKGYLNHLKLTKDALNDIEIGYAKEIKYNGKCAGAYKDNDNTIYVVSTTCPHLKCKLHFNNDTKTWDCPCHGSRYSYKGDLIDNPSQAKSILIAKRKS